MVVEDCPVKACAVCARLAAGDDFFERKHYANVAYLRPILTSIA